MGAKIFREAFIVWFFSSPYQSDCLLVSYMNSLPEMGFSGRHRSDALAALAHSGTMLCAVGTHCTVCRSEDERLWSAVMVSSFVRTPASDPQ